MVFVVSNLFPACSRSLYVCCFVPFMCVATESGRNHAAAVIPEDDCESRLVRSLRVFYRVAFMCIVKDAGSAASGVDEGVGSEGGKDV